MQSCHTIEEETETLHRNSSLNEDRKVNDLLLMDEVIDWCDER
jgi:hypothetical protein